MKQVYIIALIIKINYFTFTFPNLQKKVFFHSFFHNTVKSKVFRKWYKEIFIKKLFINLKMEKSKEYLSKLSKC